MSGLEETIFPFELYVNDSKGKKLFIEDVERILTTDLQLEDSFGCKIESCHTHVGSKRHLENFIEAELLFHNSYYNKRFAFMTVQTILNNLKESTDQIIIVGYETFSELYVCEVIEMLETLKKEILKEENKKNSSIIESIGKIRKIDYCIYEQTADKTYIRNIQRCFTGSCPNTLIVYVVPINTTLTTHDKMMEKVMSSPEYKKSNTEGKFYTLNIALITIAPLDNYTGSDIDHFWRIVEFDGVRSEYRLMLLDNKQDKLEYLKDKEICAYVLINSKWYRPQKCIRCFPDIEKRELIEETPRFRVDKASIVPMLKIGKKLYPEPLRPETKRREEENLKKVIRLSETLYHYHTYRGGNHYQYYFDLEKYFNDNKSDIERWLAEKKSQLKESEDYKDDKCYNFIIAPRHHSNAGFVRMVNDVVFNGASRIFYFDVLKEYRSNISAKYSDFIRALENIRDANQDYQVYFHYVDDTISSGSNYHRAKSLIRTILGNEKDENIHLFKSVIILLNRISDESKKSYIKNIKHFFSYVSLNISVMRNHEDACILCRLIDDYKKMQVIAATNEIRDRCQDTINKHELKAIIELEKPTKEEKLRMIIRHLLNSCISNLWWPEKMSEAVNSESVNDIYRVINQLYDNKAVFKIIGIDKKNLQECTDYAKAFIKVITRPFFTDHIRQKQASMRFCLEKLSMALFESEGSAKAIVDELIKGVSDLGANYLIRKPVVEKAASESVDWTLYNSAIKRVTTFSGEDTQSYLLECILLNGNEYPFFEEKKNAVKIKNVELAKWVMLYLENNKVLHDGFSEYCDNSEKFTKIPYYMEYFSYICGLNMISDFKESMLENDGQQEKNILKLCENFKLVRTKIGVKKDEENEKEEQKFDFKDLNILLEKFFDQENEEEKAKVRIFGSREESDLQFRYFLLENEANSNNRYEDFYDESNLREIEYALEDQGNEWIGKTICFTDKFCVIRIKPEKSGNISNDLFIQISYNKKIEYPLYEYAKEEDRKYFRGMMFGIKLILLFRNELESLAGRQNISNLVNSAYQKEIKEALKIEKAHKHGTTEYYENFKWGTRFDEKKRTFNFKEFADPECSKTRERIKALYDPYIQVQANSYIVYLYRQAVLGEKRFIEGKFKSMGSVKWFRDEVLPNFGFTKKKNTLTYEFSVCKMVNDYVTVKMICRFSKEVVNKELKFYECGAFPVGYPFILFMILMALNAGIHGQLDEKDKGKKDENKKIEIYYYFLKEKILIKNKANSDEHSQEQLRKKLDKAPWRSEKSNITLWTLQRLALIRTGTKSFNAKLEDGMFCISLSDCIQKPEY